MVNTKPNIRHKYKLRSCTNCYLWETCKSGKNRAETLVCDYGKYGCVKYVGEFTDEPPKNKSK